MSKKAGTVQAERTQAKATRMPPKPPATPATGRAAPAPGNPTARGGRGPAKASETRAGGPVSRTRSAVTGKMVSAAGANPDTTVNETVETPLDEFLRTYRPPHVIPKNFGKAADDLYETREQRLKLAKIVDAMEAHEKKLKAHFIDNLSKKESSGVAGQHARVQIVRDEEPQVQDWEETYKHIKKTGNFELLNRALNKSAVKERWKAGKEVPGVGHFPIVKVSVTKV